MTKGLKKMEINSNVHQMFIKLPKNSEKKICILYKCFTLLISVTRTEL